MLATPPVLLHANCSFRGAYWRGYTIDSQPDYKQLRRQVKADTIVSLVLIVGVTTLQAYVGAVVIGALLIAFYLGWMRYLLRGLHPSDARLSLQDSMASQARAHSVTGLWLLQIGALTFVALGISFSWSIPTTGSLRLARSSFSGSARASRRVCSCCGGARRPAGPSEKSAEEPRVATPARRPRPCQSAKSRVRVNSLAQGRVIKARSIKFGTPAVRRT